MQEKGDLLVSLKGGSWLSERKFFSSKGGELKAEKKKTEVSVKGEGKRKKAVAFVKTKGRKQGASVSFGS